MMLPPLIMQALTVGLILFGIISIGTGILLTLLASRKAPDGFEDQTGFHVGQRTDTLADGLRSPGWLDQERSGSPNPPAPP